MTALAVRILASLALVVLAIAGHLVDKHRAVDVAYKAGQAEVSGRWAIEKSVALATALQATADSQAEERRRTQSQTEVTNETQRFQVRAAAAAAAARDADGRLHEHVDAVIAAGAAGGQLPGHPATAGELEAAATLGALLNDSAARYRQLGFEADQAAAAGDDCAARYDSLTARKSTP